MRHPILDKIPVVFDPPLFTRSSEAAELTGSGLCKDPTFKQWEYVGTPRNMSRAPTADESDDDDERTIK